MLVWRAGRRRAQTGEGAGVLLAGLLLISGVHAPRLVQRHGGLEDGRENVEHNLAAAVTGFLATHDDFRF